MVSAIFRSSFASDPWILRIIKHTAGYSSKDVVKFAADDTGFASLPRKNCNGSTAPESRIWHAWHKMNDDNLVNPRAVAALSASFQEYFADELSILPNHDWETVRVSEFLKRHMSVAATRAVFGTRILEVNPGFIDAFWAFEPFGESLSFGIPSFLNRRAVSARERFRCMCRDWYALADQGFDWDVFKPDDLEWEPVFGSQVSRSMARWGKKFDFSTDSFGAAYALLFFGLVESTLSSCLKKC